MNIKGLDKLISNIIDEVDEEVENNPDLQALLKEAYPTPEPPDLSNAEEFPSITTDNNSTPNLPEEDQGANNNNNSHYISLEPHLFSKNTIKPNATTSDLNIKLPTHNDDHIDNDQDQEAKDRESDEYKSPKPIITTPNADIFATPPQFLANLSFPIMRQITSENPDPSQQLNQNNDPSIFAGGNLYMLGSEEQLQPKPTLNETQSQPFPSAHSQNSHKNNQSQQQQNKYDAVMFCKIYI